MTAHVGARKQSIIVAVNITPDVCLTPVGGAMKPVPYGISVDLAGATKVIPNVRLNGAPVYVYAHSITPPVKGDEQGTGGGVVSGVNKGKVWAFTSSKNVYAEGRQVVREGDYCWMNCK
jgi:hypothetical protein